MSLPRIDQSRFAEVSRAPGVTAVEFTAAWCGPCKTMEPILSGLAEAYAGRARFVAVDVEEQQAIAQRFDVRAMPTLVVLRDGREVGRIVGSRPRAFVAGVVERALAGDVAIDSP